ncbi:GspE/PulE family protein [Chitinivorax sp. B]|uniref:GspE/PulE family protein n=1 Tax=Chitinivorax sp. B TaxID=2502235 RepID=UPI0010F6317E|nr:GspE/PulE family protein [Chitinivorax sp. B]
MSAEQDELSRQLAFTQALQAVTNSIHATRNLDEIMLELSQSVCDLFNADRLTIYVLDDTRTAIVSKVKTGINSAKELRLPINEQSLAGFVALHKRGLNITDAYDDTELERYSRELRFLKAVDQHTGYRTKQMLVSPVLDESNRSLVGVVQLINNRADEPFSMLMERGLNELCKTLAIALKQRIGGQPFVANTKYDYLVADGILSTAEFELAARAARRKQMDLEETLIQEFQVSITAIGQSLAKFFGDSYEPYRGDRIKPAELLKNIKPGFAQSNGWLPVDETPEGIVVIALDPAQLKNSHQATQILGKQKIVYRVTTKREFDQTCDLFFGESMTLGNIDDMLSTLDEQDEEGNETVDVSAAQDNELVKLVNKIIVDAYHLGASDIHIEPYPGKQKTLIRIRRDGSLMNFIEVPAAYRSALVARLKIMCDLDISERRRPQDGKIQFKRFGPLDIELRVATVPTQGGLEDVVMRILAAGEPIPLEKLALSQPNLENLKKTVSKPYGLFFVCGPTGSGKTTTLHSVLKFLNTPETKIWTAEDPVEITQAGLRQVQMNPKAGLTFATAMKAFLRADPDVIMVGEMRDKETAATGIEASLTGHLVLATLHTNSAPESIIRLLDMGMDPFNFSDALLGILAQRLAKRLCSKCKQAYHPDDAEIDALCDEYAEELLPTPPWQQNAQTERANLLELWKQQFADSNGQFTFYRRKGCEQCASTGYKGRVGLHELLVGSDEIKKKIQEHARVAELFSVALEHGMRTLKQDGIEKVLQGLTDIHQVHTVCIK